MVCVDRLIIWLVSKNVGTEVCVHTHTHTHSNTEHGMVGSRHTQVRREGIFKSRFTSLLNKAALSVRLISNILGVGGLFCRPLAGLLSFALQRFSLALYRKRESVPGRSGKEKKNVSKKKKKKKKCIFFMGV